MVYTGNNQYRIDSWDEKRNAWYQDNNNRSYHASLVVLRESYIETVLNIAFAGKPQCLYSPYHVEDYQDWRTFARIIINTARKNNAGIFSENN